MQSAVKERNASAIVDAVINDMLNGAGMKDATAKHCGSPQTFHKLISGERELSARFARAMEFRAELWADEMIAISDDPAIDTNRARNMIQTRQWNATKANPKKFGERIDLNVQQSISVDVALHEAKARLLRPVRDQLALDAVQVLDLPSAAAHEPADKQSVSPDPVPDIFS